MKVVSWNLNGLRATLRNFAGQDLKGLLANLEADVVCFQETKATREQLDDSLYLADGYNAYFSFSQAKKGYSGVVTFCRDSASPIMAEEGLTGTLSSNKEDVIGCYGDNSHCTDKELTLLDSEGRAVLTEHCLSGTDSLPDEKRLVIINVYCPMYDPERDKEGESLDRLQFKINFYRLLEERCAALEKAGKLVLVAGDLNCSRDHIDSAYVLDDSNLSMDNPSSNWIRQFSVYEPHTLSSLAPPFSSVTAPTTTQLLDTFRYLHPTQEKAYTCWSTLLDARKTNYGTRIDYILASTSLAEKLTRAEVWQHVMGSDHCPVFAEFDLNLVFLKNHNLPSLCSYYYSAKQSKLSDFMSRCPATSAANRRESSGTSNKIGSENVVTWYSEVALERGVKRSLSTVDHLPTKHSKSSLSQKSLFSFVKNRPIPSATSSKGEDISKTSPKEVFGSSSSSPPLCSGHGEECVLRKVKKQGPNKDRKFWVCARPGGSKEDPTARCNYFRWDKERKK